MSNQVNKQPETQSKEPLERKVLTTSRIAYARIMKRIGVVCLLFVIVVSFTIILYAYNRPHSDVRPSLRTDPANRRGKQKLNFQKKPISKQYLLDTPYCRVQEFEPFHEEAKRYFEKETLELCTERPLLSSVSVNANGTHTLRLHNEFFTQYINSTPISCDYCIISIDADLNSHSVEVSKCQSLEKEVFLLDTIESVEVSCSVRTEGSSVDMMLTIYKHVHIFVGLKPEVDSKIRAHEHEMCDAHDNQMEEDDLTDYVKRNVSVMIIGIRSMSRLHLQRSLPKTVKYLNRNEWYALNVYNRVGEDTLPNLAAILTGTDMDTLDSLCWRNESATLEDCPWIWKRFSEKGYITAYGEDAPELDTFSRRNFSKSPTDYFLKPFMRAAERQSMTSWREMHLDIADCLGPVHSADHVLSYSLEFATTFGNYPTFSVFWLKTLSHDGKYSATRFDEFFVSYFKELERIRHNALVIFMSDQGQNGGGFRQTTMGFYESNLPFMYVSLPHSAPFHDKPDYQNLLENRNKLTSAFDLHVTLLEILGEAQTAPGCPTCVSLFSDIPEHRTCADAGIPQRYCSCMEYDIVSDTTPYEYLGLFAIDEINWLASSYDNYTQPNTRCAKLTMTNIMSVRSAASSDRTLKSGRDYFVITVRPNWHDEAMFEVMLSRNFNDDLNVEGDISRLDNYEKYSKCMDHPDGKKYCICEEKNNL